MTIFTTKDGRSILIRRVNQNDTPQLVDMFYQSSEHTRRMRFHCGSSKCPDEHIWREATRLCHLNPKQHVALAATIQEHNSEQIVGVARFGRKSSNDTEAEIGVIVRDDFQGVGLGTQLLIQLTHVAHTMQISHFRAWILPENHKLLHLIRKIGHPIKQETKYGETCLVISIAETKVSKAYSPT